MQPKRKMDYRLTKVGYLRYLSCPPEFWLEVHEPLLFVRDMTLEDKHLRQQGYDVEWHVKQLARFRSDDRQSVDFQRTFHTSELMTRSDIVVTDSTTGAIDIYEVKGSSKVKPEHYDDVAYQKYVAERMGERVRNCYVVTLNGDYVRDGEIDNEQLFVITDVTDEVSVRQEETEKQIADAFRYLESIPVPSLAEYCIDNKLDCRFLKARFPDLPEYTVFDISYLKHDKRRELLRSNIIDINDVPDDFPLSPKQRSQVNAAKSGEEMIDREAIAKRVCDWQYPLHFLDYETFSYAIPQFDGVKPFQQMCFQYSLHTIDAAGAEMRHSEYLSHGIGNPARDVAEHLRDAMSGGIGTVFVWFEGFEKARNDEMAEMFPDLADFFAEVNAKTCDLMKIFADNLYVHPDFKGKTSIKKVLPVLAPDLSYSELGIGDGMTATIRWFHAATRRNMDESERLRIFNDLHEYCKLDTIAMVRIYDVLREL